MIEKLMWKLQDIIDVALDRLNGEQRWKIIDFLMMHDIIDVCRVNGYFWATCIGDDSLFDLGSCSWCRDSPYCYCGKERE